MTTEAVAERNILEEPFTPEEWDNMLGNDTGEQVAAALEPLSTRPRLLRLHTPVVDVKDTVAMVVEDMTGRDFDKVRREIRLVSATDMNVRAEVAAQQEEWPSVKDKLDFFLRWGFMRKYTDQMAWTYAFSHGDPNQFITVGQNFFNKLSGAKITNKFDSFGPLSNLMWRTLVHTMKFEAMLVASGKPDEAAEMELLKDLCFQGNYPLGVDKAGSFVVLTA